MKKMLLIFFFVVAGCSAGKIELSEKLSIDFCSARIQLKEGYDQLGPVIDLYLEREDESVVIVLIG